ncbi:MAG: cobyrinic acid a,c-diamide synthase [Clostridiales bacterium]|nr:cobyrinic acid a,c-diamide synthase [Clostridiales bacterium]
MKAPRIMIAGTKSGSGKTVLTCALLKTLLRKKIPVRSFKCGPDFIDPMFHREVIGVPSRNLDLFFTDEGMTRALFLEGLQNEISVIEGVMGLYDGISLQNDLRSSYHVARVTQTPIILVVDAHGVGRSILAHLAGFLAFDQAHLIKGVILNRISPMYYAKIKPVIEAALEVKVLGCLPKQNEFILDSRHLGLALPAHINDLQDKLFGLSEAFMEWVDLELLLSIASDTTQLLGEMPEYEREKEPLRIGVAKDEAFCFYYEDNLRLLEKMGATLCEFSPLHDRKLPDNLQGLLLGGGYPELMAKELSENKAMRTSMQRMLANKLPSLAECGGFLYLQESLTDLEGMTYPMVGVVKAHAKNEGRLVRFGYIDITSKGDIPAIRGHEFHYYESSDNGEGAYALRPSSEKGWNCAHVGEEKWWGFPHLYYYSNPAFVRWFLKAAKKYQENQRV